MSGTNTMIMTLKMSRTMTLAHFDSPYEDVFLLGKTMKITFNFKIFAPASLFAFIDMLSFVLVIIFHEDVSSTT